MLENGDYRDLLRKHIDTLIDAGKSYRELSRDAGFSSPNYLQQVLAGKRNLSVKAAQGVAVALKLSKADTSLLLAQVRLAHKKLSPSDSSLGQLRAAVAGSRRRPIKDASIHDSWLYAVIFELAQLTTIPLSEESAVQLLAGRASASEVKQAFQVLKQKRWLLPVKAKNGSTHYKQGEIEFQPLDDVRKIALQQNHLRFLDMAKHRVTDDLHQREYRGLTVAIPMDHMHEVKSIVRDAFSRISELADTYTDKDCVIRVQCAAFAITKPFESGA